MARPAACKQALTCGREAHAVDGVQVGGEAGHVAHAGVAIRAALNLQCGSARRLVGAALGIQSVRSASLLHYGRQRR